MDIHKLQIKHERAYEHILSNKVNMQKLNASVEKLF